MLTFGIIVVLLIGFLLVANISTRFSWIEKLGLSFPIGLGVQTLLMAFINLCGVRLTAGTVLSSGLIMIFLLAVLLYRRRAQNRVCSSETSFGPCIPKYNLVWMLFMALIVYFEYMNFVKCMYFPTFDRDSLAGFDTIGYVIAQERTFKGLSLFDAGYVTHIHNAGSYITYIPMVQLSYAWVYILGAETSKLIPALMYLFFLIGFYGATKRVLSHTATAITTFFVLITPEMISFSSLSATNVIHAIMVSLGVIYAALWFREKHQKDLTLGSVLLGLNIWTRTDGVVFILAALVVVGIACIKKKEWRTPLPLLGAFIPLLFWMLFCKVSNFYAESIAITHPYWDAEKAGTIWKKMLSHVTNSRFYGASFLFFAFSLLANSWFIIKRRDNLPLLAMIVIAFVGYMMALYHVDYKWDSIHNVLAYSAKRFLFCFIPLVWFYAVSNRWATKMFDKMDGFLE